MKEALAPIRNHLKKHLGDTPGTADFLRRFDRFGPDAAVLLATLYGDRADYVDQLEAIFLAAADYFMERPERWKQIDTDREANPTWYQHHEMMGGVCYVDQFAGTLAGIREKIPYFKELGLTYLHLMPLYQRPRTGPHDGGYAVRSYREVADDLGTMDELKTLAGELCDQGISLVLDLVFNHTAEDHDWALKARAGDPEYQDFFFMFDDREMPDAYDQNLREIFPDEHSGCFTYFDDVKKWVWTTFHHYQWDLNYRNPAMFRAMLGEMLFLANVGTSVLRLDAVPFIWKQLGTSCENLPQAHTIIRAFNTLVRIAAPAMVFKSEAIVHPDNVKSYFGSGEWAGRECEISYNPLLMVEMWEPLATQHTHLLSYSMKHRFAIPDNCAWVNYVRSHDDIGWGFADEDAEALYIHGFDHRQYLNRFYTRQEPNSFSVGYPFQFNPKNLDMRISGRAASLAGLERAVNANDPHLIDLAIRRILLIHSVILSMGGIPLIYLGDEIGMLNDYEYKNNPDRVDDSRWTHRGPFDWERAEQRHDPTTIPGRIFTPLTRLIGIRKQQPAFGSAAQTEVIDTGNMHIYGYVKAAGDDRIVCLTNFSEEDQHFDSGCLPDGVYRDLVKGEASRLEQTFGLGPYAFRWLAVG